MNGVDGKNQFIQIFSSGLRKSALVMLAFLQHTSLVVFFIIAWKVSGNEIRERNGNIYITFLVL